jgi:uncharacterized protein YgiB involved in biofilm formation
VRKSRSVQLALMGTAAMTMAACGDAGPPPDSRFFADVKECTSQTGDAQACEAAKAESEKTHAQEAPKFARKEQCEAEFGAGNCETQQAASGGGSFFMPLLMGYMMGNMMSGGNRFSQPVYQGRDGKAVMPANGRMYNVGNFNRGGTATAFQPASRVSEVSRGGFGGTSTRYRSSGG